MTRVALIILCLAFFAMPAWAAPVPEAQYRETMAKLEETQALMLATIDDFHNGISAEDARARLPLLRARLQWVRDAKVEAAKSDASATLRRFNAERRRAACIIQRSGAMDEPLQDIVVNVTLKARGVTDAELLPLDRKAVEGLGVGSGCRGVRRGATHLVNFPLGSILSLKVVLWSKTHPLKSSRLRRNFRNP